MCLSAPSTWTVRCSARTGACCELAPAIGSKLAREGSSLAGSDCLGAGAETAGAGALGAGACWEAAAARGALGAARGAELRLLPINKDNAGAMPLLCSFNSSSKRLRYFSLTQSRTNRLGAYTRNSSPSASTCSGRIQVLNCWAGSSSRKSSTHCCQSSTDTDIP